MLPMTPRKSYDQLLRECYYIYQFRQYTFDSTQKILFSLSRCAKRLSKRNLDSMWVRRYTSKRIIGCIEVRAEVVERCRRRQL